MKRNLASLILLLPFFVLACSDPRPSELDEAPDSVNHVSRFEITEMPDYATIAAQTVVATSRIPWSDTFWPFVNRGLALRWSPISPDFDTKLGFMSFWLDQRNLPAEKYWQLSPAEKYDFVYRLRWNVPVDQSKIEEELAPVAVIEESYDYAASLSDKRNVFVNLFNSYSRASNLKASAPLTFDSMLNWLKYNKMSNYKLLNEPDSGEGWGWMGYCHGWAAAALMADAPRHAVLAMINGQEILFSEGDIRGLLTKAWADYSPQSQILFLGRRCNENTHDEYGPIPADGDGRGLSGNLKNKDGKIRPFLVVDEYLTTNSARRVYQISFTDDDSLSFVAEEKGADAKLRYYLSADLNKIRSFVGEGRTDGMEALTQLNFYGCWDLNPASFHTVLLDYIGKRNTGIIMDRTRTGQVWNQPVQAAEFTVGELLDVADVEDKSFRYRAMGTEYLAQVTAKVFWSSEPSLPSFDYSDDFDASQIRTSSYRYTLEFDANKRLIGGEWGDFGSIDPKLVVPDFLFAFRQGAVPRDNASKAFDYSGIIGPLLNCSQASEGIETMHLNGKDIAFTRCALEAAN